MNGLENLPAEVLGLAQSGASAIEMACRFLIRRGLSHYPVRGLAALHNGTTFKKIIASLKLLNHLSLILMAYAIIFHYGLENLVADLAELRQRTIIPDLPYGIGKWLPDYAEATWLITLFL